MTVTLPVRMCVPCPAVADPTAQNFIRSGAGTTPTNIKSCKKVLIALLFSHYSDCRVTYLGNREICRNQNTALAFQHRSGVFSSLRFCSCW